MPYEVALFAAFSVGFAAGIWVTALFVTVTLNMSDPLEEAKTERTLQRHPS